MDELTIEEWKNKCEQIVNNQADSILALQAQVYNLERIATTLERLLKISEMSL